MLIKLLLIVCFFPIVYWWKKMNFSHFHWLCIALNITDLPVNCITNIGRIIKSRRNITDETFSKDPCKKFLCALMTRCTYTGSIERVKNILLLLLNFWFLWNKAMTLQMRCIDSILYLSICLRNVRNQRKKCPKFLRKLHPIRGEGSFIVHW